MASTITTTETELESAADIQPYRPVRATLRRFAHHKMAMVALAVLAALVLAIALADFWTPYAPNEIAGMAAGADKFAPPGYVNPHNGDVYLLGTDYIGRDVVSRLAYGGQISLSIGLLVTFTITLIGILIGALGGYFGGLVDRVTSGLTDLVLTLPFIQVLLVLSFLLGPYYWSMFFILAAFGWGGTSRLVRASLLSLRNYDYVEATRALGASNWRIITRHLLPNMFSLLIVDMTINIGVFIIAESSVSFLGLGISEPVSSWGNMLSWLDDMVKNAPLQIIWPGLLIFITVLCCNIIGDALRDALDPRRRVLAYI